MSKAEQWTKIFEGIKAAIEMLWMMYKSFWGIENNLFAFITLVGLAYGIPKIIKTIKNSIT